MSSPFEKTGSATATLAATATLEERVSERTRELQRSNEQARRINRELQAISTCNQVLMRAVDEPALLNDICRIVCEQAGYRMACVGYAENDDAKTVRIVARAGFDDGYLAAAHLTWDDTDHGRGPTGVAIRTGASQWIDDFATAPSVAPWRELALQRGYRSSLALPLKDESARTFGALAIYATELNAFPPEEVRLMEALAADLAFGIAVLRDRHERRHAEAELRRSERGLSEAQRLTHLGSWELDLVRNVLTWSDEIYRIFEIDRAKFAASYEAFLNLIHPEDRDLVNRAYIDSLTHKSPYEITHRLRMADGRIKHVSERCETYYDETGRPVRSVGTVQDITERKLAEAALRESEERYRTLIQKLQTAVVVHAEDTHILTCNPIAQSLLGLTEDQLLDKTALDPAWHFFREDGTRMPPEEYPVNRVRATRQPVRNLVLGVHRPGDAPDVWAMVNANPDFGPDGEITRIIVTFIDITERKRAQERLDHLAAIVESSDDAIIGKTLDETIVSWNRGAERIYGYTAGEIVGRPVSILVPPGLKAELAAIMDGVKRGQGVAHLETTRVRKDGQTIHVVLTISPIRDARGQIVGASTIARDNTEHKRMEEALVFVAQRGWQTGGENFFDALARFLGEKLDLDYALIDKIGETPEMAETVALYAKGTLAPNMRYALKGTPCENVMGRNLCVYRSDIQQLFPEDVLLPQMGAESYVGIPLWDSTGKPIGLIAVMGTKPLPDDTPVTQLLRLVATRAAAELERRRAEDEIRKLNAELEQRVADRTRELAGSEERMRLFFERQLMGSAITSPEKGWLQVNDKLCQMLGYAREELLRLTWAELTHPEDLAADVAQFERLLRGEIESYTIEKRFVRKDGSLVYTNLAVGCVRRPDRSVDYLLALLEDITERKQAEADIRRLNEELRQRATSLEVANKELESFSYSVSHDLRAPLRSIDGFSRMLLEDCADRLDANAGDNLRRIRAASQRMGYLIDDLLKLAQVSRGEMRRSRVDLSVLARTVAEELRRTMPKQQLEFVIAPEIVANGDARLLRVVLENLLGNACKFSSKRSVSHIEFGETQRDGQRAFFVRDNGAGFDPAHAGRMFEAFRRFHGDTEFPGTGIGLATVHRIIRRHGGTVTAEGRPDAGATFFFTLPDQPPTRS